MKIRSKSYSVLWGQHGVKEGFKKPSTARKFAQMKANTTGKRTEIDTITTYSGRGNWSQGHYTYVKPRKKK